MKPIPSIRQEFIASVQTDTTTNLAKRLVVVRRRIRRAEYLMGIGEPTYGCLSLRCKHAEILKGEILKRIKARKIK